MKNQIVYNKRQLLGALSSWIIQQHPFMPDNLTEIITEADRYIEKHHKPVFEWLGSKVYEYPKRELYRRMEIMCHRVPLIKELNLSKYEKTLGYSVDDKRRKPYRFTSTFEVPSADNDYVSLGALARNIANELVKEHESVSDIDKRFSSPSSDE